MPATWQPPSAGPAYKTVALKYKDNSTAPERLAQKVLSRGAGIWGQIPMPPHPQHSIEQISRMVACVLSLKDDSSSPPQSGTSGTFSAPKQHTKGSLIDDGVLVLTAAYTEDDNQNSLPRLREEKTIVLHSRRKKAALYDKHEGVECVEHVYGEKGLVGHFKDGSYVLWRDLNLYGNPNPEIERRLF